MKTAAIVQARTASTRFPGKVFVYLDGKPALDQLISRLHAALSLDSIIIAVPKEDIDLISYCLRNQVNYFEGDPINVRQRVLDCAARKGIDIIIDITGDCPLVDFYHVNNLVSMVKDYGYDYASNIDPRSFPDGFDVQAYPTAVLSSIHKIDPEAPHVGWQILNLLHKGEIQLKTFNLPAPLQLAFPEMRLTLDTPEDAKVLDAVFKSLGTHASAIEITAFMMQHPELQEINKHVRTKKPEEG